MSEDVLMAIAFTAGIVMIVGHLVRLARTTAIQKTIREAIRTDSPLTADLLDRIDQAQPASTGDDRTGLILLALGAALLCYGLIQGRPEDIRELSGVALFPIFVGAALLGRDYFLKSKKGDRS